jgi:hypothetical protein
MGMRGAPRALGIRRGEKKRPTEVPCCPPDGTATGRARRPLLDQASRRGKRQAASRTGTGTGYCLLLSYCLLLTAYGLCYLCKKRLTAAAYYLLLLTVV